MARTKARHDGELRRGWTTGACAAAATKAAFAALLTGKFPDPVTITLPGGETPAFALALEGLGEDWARAGIIKDAGDDPDVTHGALVISTVRRRGKSVTFERGEGVGLVTRPGLPVAPGEPAINPVPRQMMRQVIEELAQRFGVDDGVAVEISIPGGEEMAKKTWNPRLGITGGLSVLGTTGIVKPFSCAAWIASIQRGIDVARAMGLDHVAGATGSTSQAAVQRLYDLPLEALIDMGDFVGGMLKYLRRHPVAAVTVAGGFAKMVKMAQGARDLHSGRSQVDFAWLGGRVGMLGGGGGLIEAVCAANTAAQALELATAEGIDLTADIALKALETGRAVLGEASIVLSIVVVDRKGRVVGRAG